MLKNTDISWLAGLLEGEGSFSITGNWNEAATEMLDSKWAKQVGERAARLAEQMETGQWA